MEAVFQTGTGTILLVTNPASSFTVVPDNPDKAYIFRLVIHREM
jgi:hypothetical protein